MLWILPQEDGGHGGWWRLARQVGWNRRMMVASIDRTAREEHEDEDEDEASLFMLVQD